MKKAKAIELLKLAVPIKALTQQEYADFVEAVNMGMDALKAQLSKEGTTSELISRQDALDIFDDYNVSVENGELEAYSRDRKRLCDLPPIQPEPTDINAKEAVYNLAEKIGIHQLFALTVELRGEPIQPEPQEGYWIRRGCGLDIECKCSVCGYKDFVEPHDIYWFKRNYCPNCGARMKGATP